MFKKLESRKGFTLVELIIVIAILAIIMLIAIPNFSGIQQRMQVRADKSTAAQIGKAVRVWFTDYTTDKALVAEAEKDSFVPVAGKNADNEDLNGVPTIGGVVAYDDLAGISEYISTGKRPDSLEADGGAKEPHQFYCISITEDATSSGAKIVVSICRGEEVATGVGADGEAGTDDDPTDITIDTDKLPTDWENDNYDGKAPAVAYIEP